MQFINYKLMKVIYIIHAECRGIKEKDGLEWSLDKSFINTEVKITSDTQNIQVQH